LINYDSLIPEPRSRFAEIKCGECGSTSVVFTMAKSNVNCKFCASLLARPAGGKATLFGTVLSAVDDLPKIPIGVDKTGTSTVVKLLLDTMIIHQLLEGKPIHELIDCNPHDIVELVVLDRVLIETKNMEKDKFNSMLDVQEITDRLSRIGGLTCIQVDHASVEVARAMELFESKRYIGNKGVPLSMTDCILLETALKMRKDDVILLTLDKALMDALEKEGKMMTTDI